MVKARIRQCKEEDCTGIMYAGGGTILKCHRCGSKHDYGSQSNMKRNTRYFQGIDIEKDSFEDYLTEEIDEEMSFKEFSRKHY